MLIVAAVKAIFEDKKRHQEDHRTNKSTAHVVHGDGNLAAASLSLFSAQYCTTRSIGLHTRQTQSKRPSIGVWGFQMQSGLACSPGPDTIACMVFSHMLIDRHSLAWHSESYCVHHLDVYQVLCCTIVSVTIVCMHTVLKSCLALSLVLLVSGTQGWSCMQAA